MSIFLQDVLLHLHNIYIFYYFNYKNFIKNYRDTLNIRCLEKQEINQKVLREDFLVVL